MWPVTAWIAEFIRQLMDERDQRGLIHLRVTMNIIANIETIAVRLQKICIHSSWAWTAPRGSAAPWGKVIGVAAFPSNQAGGLSRPNPIVLFCD